MGKPASKSPGSWIWCRLTGATRWLYRAVGQSPLGKLMTSYRQADTLFHHHRRRTLRDDCRPMSPARLRLLESVRESRFLRGFSRVFSLLAYTPAAIYGLFLLFCGLFNFLIYFVGPMIFRGLHFDTFRLYLYGVLIVAALPLLFSGQPMVRLLSKGRLTKWLFVSLLGFPEEPTPKIEHGEAMRRFKRGAPYLAFLLGALCAVASVWVHPLLIPGVMLIMGLCGMVFASPESGVVLTSLLLPMVFWQPDAIRVIAALVLLTWLSYGVKLLFMHRTIRFSLMDVAVLLFALSLGLSGMTGGYVTSESITYGLLALILYSLYFLIANLMNERAWLGRCLVGPAVTFGLTVLAVGVAALPDGLWDFLAGSRGGDAVKQGLETVMAAVSHRVQPYDLCVFLMAIPLFGSLLLRRGQRLFYYGGITLLLLLSLGCLYLMGSMGSLLTAILCLLLMLLLYSHRFLSAGILSLPWLLCGGYWLATASLPWMEQLKAGLIRNQAIRERLWTGAWRTVCHHPAGIGLGSHAFSSVYPMYAETGYTAATGVSGMYMEILLVMGIPGLILFVFMMFLFLQKALSCLRISEHWDDTAYLLGGLFAVSSLLIYGIISDAPCYMPAMMAAVLALGICNAYENLVFDSFDAATARMSKDDCRADALIHTS